VTRQKGCPCAIGILGMRVVVCAGGCQNGLVHLFEINDGCLDIPMGDAKTVGQCAIAKQGPGAGQAPDGW
jgi:hypothetical protein